MHWIESLPRRLRHLPGLRGLGGLWNVARPLYERMLSATARGRGLERRFNGMDTVRILPEWRVLPDEYEPEVWKMLLPQVRAGDCVVDVGAHVGVYAMAFAGRVGAGGRVVAVEADPEIADTLRAHCRLNQVEHVVEVVQKAVSDREGEVSWHSQDMQSVAVQAGDGEQGCPRVPTTTLDILMKDRRADVMLVDIEGYEEPALRGGERLLKDPARRPRLIVVEVHPYNWALCGGSSASLLGFLGECGYAVRTLDGLPVHDITSYGHVAATPAP